MDQGFKQSQPRQCLRPENIPMFRFTIRDVLWLTVVVALGVGWIIDSSNRARENRLLQLERNAARDAETAIRAIVARDQQSPPAAVQ